MILSTLRRTFQKHPLAANVVTLTLLLGSADITCQVIENKGFSNFSVNRLRNMATMGIVYYGPVYFYYYRFLDRKLPGKDRQTIFIKLAIDQILFTFPSLCMFYLGMGLLEHKTFEESKIELKSKLLPTYTTACLFWPAAQFVNFRVVPATYRVVYISMASFVWLIFLSYIKNRQKIPVFLQKIDDFSKRLLKRSSR